MSTGRFAAAAQAYAEVRDSFAALGDTVNEWYGQLWWAETMTRSGQPDSAALGLARADSLSGGDARRAAWVAIMRSKLHERTGQYDSAIALAERAVTAAEEAHDPEIAFWAYDTQGTALSMRGRFREALHADSSSLAIRRAIGATRTIAQGLNEVAIGYRHLGRYDEARTALEESYRLASAGNDTLAMALARGNISNVWDLVGDRDRAIAALLEAKAYVDAIGHRRFMIAAGNQLAAHLLETGNPDSAAALAQRSLGVARDTRNFQGEIDARGVIGGAALALGRAGEARQTLTDAIAMADDAGLGSYRASLRSQLVSAEITLGNTAAALQAADAAVEIADSLGDPSLQLTALQARAQALEAARDPGAADAFGTALDLLESLRGRLAMGDLKMGVAAPRLGAYEGAIRALLLADRPLEAFHVAERARARFLLELMADRGVIDAPTPRNQVRNRLREAYEARVTIDDPELIAQLDREIDALGDSLAAIERALAGNEGGASPYPEVLSPITIRQTLLGPDRAMLAYFWGDSTVVGWWLTADSVRSATLGSVRTLGATIDFLMGALQHRDDPTLWRAAAARAYRDLVAPLAPTPAQVILVVADGPLHRVPLEILMSDRGGEPWGARGQFTYGPSASVLATLARAPTPGWSRTLLAVGNPTPGAGTAPLEAGRPLRTETLGTLPHAESEARALHEMFENGADLLVGRRATVDRWLDRDPGRYRYLHFAMHAVASDHRPESGALLFAGQRLDLMTIRGLRLQAELATLSACETGIGRWVRGEGVVGMQHAFLSAGARSVVVSLWQVADESTADFMREFYSLLRDGRSPPEALAQVKATWIRLGGDRSHPWRWAPFVLIGAPAP